MKTQFFKQMLEELKPTSDVEVLTDPEARALKGGCTCKNGSTYNAGAAEDVKRESLQEHRKLITGVILK